MLGIFNSNFASLFWAFLYTLHKQCNRTKVEFFYKDLRIKVVFSKNCQKSPNFHIFVSIFIVNVNLELKFLGSAQRCSLAINISSATLYFSLNEPGPVSGAQWSNPFFALWKYPKGWNIIKKRQKKISPAGNWTPTFCSRGEGLNH